MSQLQRLHKLRKMPPREIRDRIADKLRVWRERRQYQSHNATAPSTKFLSNKPFNLCYLATTLVPGVKTAQLQRLKENFPQSHAFLAAEATSRAEAVLSGSWNLLGYPVDLQDAVDWHADPRTEHHFPQDFYADLSLYELGNTIDVKYVWELGRHQYLVELARGWLFTGETRYAERSRDLILDWIEHNPLYEGVHWTSSLELAMRAISWIWTLATLAEWDGWQTDELDKISNSLAEHAIYIEHHLSYYSSPYNHLVGEGAGLYLIGCVLSGTDAASRWKRLGRRVLCKHGPRQFYDDGFCVEQATGYHFYTLGFLSLAVVAARATGEPLEEFEPIIQRAFQAGLPFRQPGGRWPAIGDVDSARAIPVHHDDFWEFDSLCAVGATLFANPQLKPPGCDFSEEAYWLLGCDAVETLADCPDEPNRKVAFLEDSGYAIACSEDDWICFDAGPLGDGLHADATPSTAHGHADSLQVLYMHKQREVLIDPGMPFYFGDNKWVGHFRGPAAHNTLEIEGVEMARRAGQLAWSHVAPRAELDVNFNDEAWIARGQAQWDPGVTVERNLLAIPGRGLWIADWITSDRPRQMKWFWQLPEGCLEDSRQTSRTHSMFEGNHLRLATWSDEAAITTTIESADDASPVAWNAPGYGVHRHGQRVRCELTPSTQVLVVTFFGSEPLPLEVTVHKRHVACRPDDNTRDMPEFAHFAESHDESEIVWRLEIGGTHVTYSAGNIVGEINTDHVIPGRAGNWPVTRQVIAPSSVQ